MMIKHVRALSALAFFLSLLPAEGQVLNCSMSASESGYDDDAVTTTISDFSCIDTVANAFVTEMSISAEIAGTFSSNCPSYYDFILEVNGNIIPSDSFCSQVIDLSDYVDDLNSITSVSLISSDNDSPDYITLDMDLDISYLITTCPPPSDLEVTSIGSSTALFSWTPNGSEVLWDIELVDITAGDTATGVPTTYGAIADSIELTSLAVDNMYEIYVRANCATGTNTESIWVGPIAFETEPTCYPVSDITISDILDVSAEAEWESDESEWEIELVDVTGGGSFGGVPTITGLTDPSYSFSGLTPDNVYNFKVRANCGPVDGNSVWSSIMTFTTDPSCIAPSDIEITAITDSSVTLTWVSNDTETLWGLELVNIDNGEVADLTADYNAADTTYTINGLDPNTEYEVFVNAECLVSDFSDWTGSGAFTTLCVPAELPFIDSLNVWPSDCYSLSNSGTSNNWQEYSGTPGVIEVDFWNFQTGTVIFETGEINISEEALFEFDWSSAGNTTWQNEMTVSYSADEGVTWTDLWNQVGPQLESNDGASAENPGSFTTTQFLLPTSVIGQDLVFRFHGVSGWGPNFFIDEIRVLPLPDCNIAYDLELDTTLATEATFSFYDIVGDNSLSWDYMVTSFNDTLTGNVTTNPFTITGLTPGTEYELQLSTICSGDTTEYTDAVPFITGCTALASFEEGFEAYDYGDLPHCWSKFEEAGSTTGEVRVTTTTGYNNSSRSFYLNNSSSSVDSLTHVMVITPELLDISDNWLKFKHRTSSNGNQKLVIGYLTDDTLATSFVGLDTVDLTQNVWGEANFIPSDYTFNGSKIAIKGLFDGADRYLYLDDVVWEPIPECYYPYNVEIDSTNLNSVYATIDPYSSTDAVWEVELVNLTNGETFTGVPTDTVTTSIFYIDGLDHSSQYEMYIRTNCGTQSSIWSWAYTFNTECDAITDFVQGFEIGTTCWTLNNVSTSSFSENTLTGDANNGDYANYLTNYSSNDPNQTFIATVTPELSNLNAGTHWIKFEARRAYFWDSASDIELGTMSDPTDPTTFNHIITFELDGSYDEYHYSFVEYTGTDSYIALRLLIDGNYREVDIDDIVWEPAPECATPENLVTVDVQDITAEIDWDPISIDSVWYLEITDITNGGVTTDSTTSHPFTLTGLTQNSIYQVNVQAGCDTNWSDPLLFTTLISHDIEVTDFVSPGSNACQLTANEEVVVTLTNNGAQDATGFDVLYSFDGVNFTSDGTFTGTLAGNSDTAYTLNTLFDFSTADDTNLYVVVDLAVDTIMVENDTNSTFITNLGDVVIQLEIETGNYAYENSWYVIDTASNTTVASYTSGGYDDGGEIYNYDVCVFIGNTYSIEAWDSYGDGWNGGIYTLTQCGGVLVANNDGLSPTTAPNQVWGGQLESQEYFTIEECDDYDLGIISMDSIVSTCGMTAAEQGYLLVQNFGLMDITAASNASIEYQVNGSGWANLATLTDLASGADTLLALPTVDMTTPLTYAFEFQVIYALDENANNDTLELDIESVDTYDEVEQDFDDAPSGWTAHVISGTALSWEWGLPTTSVISAGVDGNAWITRLHDDMFLNEISYLLSPCFDFSSYSNDVEFSFDFIWTSPNGNNEVKFQVSTDGGQSWSDEMTMPVNTTEWVTTNGLVDLAGESDVKFRFRMQNGFSTDAEGFGMDNFQVFEHVPYTDTTLSDLTVDGLTIAGFDPAVFNYTYEVPYGTTVVPTVDAVVNAPFYESLEITQASGIPGMATVLVTAEDTNFTGTYTVDFVEAPASTNAYITSVDTNGNVDPAFDSLSFTNTYTLPYGTTTVPTLDFELSDTNATADVTIPTGLPGSYVVVVTAQDGANTNTYTFNFELEPADVVSSLDDISIDGVTIPGFHPDTLDYTVVSVGPVVTVGYVPTSNFSTVTTNPTNLTAVPVPSTVVITVTAQDGSITVYTINLVEPLSDDATLTELTYDEDGSGIFTLVPGFDSEDTTYTIELPYGSSVPPVDYVTSDAGATVVVVDATAVPGTTTVTVTAADGTVKTYTIEWTEAAPNSNNYLASLQVGDGTNGILYQGGLGDPYATQGFDPTVNEYRFYIDDLINASVIHVLTAIPQVMTSDVEIISPLVYPGTYYVHVTAENGDVNTYIVHAVNGIGQEELDAGSVSMYPNPSTGIVNVKVTDQISDYSIEVVSATGQRVFSNEYANDNNEASLDLSSVANGIYYVVVKDLQTGKSAREKISIIK